MEAFSYEFWKADRNQKNITIYDNDFASVTSIEEAVYIRRMLFFWDKWKKKSPKGIHLRVASFIDPVSMSKYSFRKITTKWEKLGILTTKIEGLDHKKWFKLNEKKLAAYLTDLFHKSHEKNDEIYVDSKTNLRGSKTNLRGSKTNLRRFENEPYSKSDLSKKNNSKKNNSPSGQGPSVEHTNPNPVSYGRIQKLIPDTSTTPLKPKAHSKKTKISSTAKEEIQLQQAYKVATKLQFALSYNNWISWTPNLNKWIKGIIKLRKADLNPVKFKDMLIAIAFLKEHGNEIHCPKPKNADQFANKYPQILDAIKRNKGQLKDDSKNSSNNIHDDSSCNDRNKLPLGCKCQKCQRTDLPVYLIIQPGTFNESAKVCKKCFRKLDKIFRDRQENEK